ncbi:membrane alanyl aminopeptidase isoform X1 [Helicoverpa armigera]|uniref:membrane alanyl aminopeptidase isoform X1 n=1 Tax=Helicoverpa armigera TaxID=29058 RepID=UPI003082BA76
MVRSRIKWKCVIISYILLFNVFTKSLPLDLQIFSLPATDPVLRTSVVPSVHTAVEELVETFSEATVQSKNVTNQRVSANENKKGVSRHARPDQRTKQYAVEITIDGNAFKGRVALVVNFNYSIYDDSIVLYAEDLIIDTVKVGIHGAAQAVEVDFVHDNGKLEFKPKDEASSFEVIIVYRGKLMTGARGLFKGRYDEHTYVGMNLHPTYARHVFPCVDEPDVPAAATFMFNNMQYSNILANSMLMENSQNEFRTLTGPLHVWGMIAHDFVNINIPTTNVMLIGRPGLSNQDSQASIAINTYFNNLNEWTGKSYQEIIVDQDGRMNIIALPDVSTDWNSLSIVGIWEPYVFMEATHSIKQRKTALIKIAEGMCSQYFGYVIFPENWRFQWVVSGLSTYMAYEMMRMFQGDVSTDVNQIDVNAIFVTEVIQEALLQDAYSSAAVLQPGENIDDQDAIRGHINGVLKYKAPALMRMMRLVLGDEDTDFIQIAASALLNRAPLQAVNSVSFISALNSEFLGNNNGNVENIEEYLEPWLFNNGYPLIRVDLRPGIGVFLSQERFGFANQQHINYNIPITYTTSREFNFDASRTYPVEMMDNSLSVPMTLDEEDFVLFNIQGQGYYRVNYDDALWERIIEALEEPEIRDRIHPLNRATLVDDALNVARKGILDYEIAFHVVLTMEHETEYAVWKAFVRNMEFLRKRLVALVDDDEDLDPDIYLRMVRRTVGGVERELSFNPDVTLTEPVMSSLTRGLVMDHACRARYQPCIAAAVDWFYDPNNNDVVNPNIPHDIRPAVYCTMVREGGEEVRDALFDRLEIEPTHYERVVILESLGCSQDSGFIQGYLADTVNANSPYLAEERVKIFRAVAESSQSNALLAYQLISTRTADVRRMYGGPEKLEEVIFALADNVVGEDFIRFFREWVNSNSNQLDDSEGAALRAFEQVLQNEQWENNQMMDVYEWIDENHAPTLMLSFTALLVSVVVAFLNN